MRPNLCDVLVKALIPGNFIGFISHTGSVSGGRRADAPVIFRHLDFEDKSDMHDVFRAYFENNGLFPFIRSPLNWLYRVAFWRKKDGARFECEAYITNFKVDRRHTKVLANAGINQFLLGRAWVSYIDRGPHEALYNFLRDAGVRLEEYTPPWFRETQASMRVEPFIRRPGAEDARFFGF